MKILQDLSSGFFLTNDAPRKDTWKIVQDFQGPFPRTSLTVPTALYVWLSTIKITQLKLGSNCNYSSYVLGSSSIWMLRISNICFDFFNCACLRQQKQIFEIQHVQIDELPRTLLTYLTVFEPKLSILFSISGI